MSEVKEPVVEADFEEVAGEEQQGQEEISINVEFSIRMMSDGALDIHVPEGRPELKPIEIESLTREVYEQLHDIRVATKAIEIFKERLG